MIRKPPNILKSGKRLTFALLSVIIILGMFSGNVFSIVSSAASTVTIDVTGLVTGSQVSHDCNLYLVTEYDENQHWQRCTICDAIYSKENHNMVDAGWTGNGSSDCSESNVHRYTCSCGYETSNTYGRAAHDYWDAGNNPYLFVKAWQCSHCNSIPQHECIKADGSRIGPGNLGTCALCGFTYTEVLYHSTKSYGLEEYEAGEAIYSLYSNEYMGTCVYNYVTFRGYGELTHYACVEIPWGGQITSQNFCGDFVAGARSSGNTRVDNFQVRVEGNRIYFQQDIHYTGHEEYYSCSRFAFDWCYPGDTNIYKYHIFIPHPVAADLVVPTINAINIADNNVNGWSTTKTITINGTESYCHSVNVKVVENATGRIIVDSVPVVVSNGWYSYSFTPDIEVDASGKTYSVTVYDSYNNIATTSYTVYKTDKVGPLVPETMQNTGNSWSKTKSFTTSVNDYGVGQVSVSFNNQAYVSANQSGVNFSQPFTLTGDVYSNVISAINYKDGLGNVSTSYLRIYYLDNTAPTISTSSANGHNTSSITISASDYNSNVKSYGSGQTPDGAGNYGLYFGYSRTNNSSTATWSALQKSTSYTFSGLAGGTYYVWAKDYVGNISDVKEVYVQPTYTITYNGNGNTGGSTVSQTKTYGVNLNLRTNGFTKTGYIFTKWNTKADGSGTSYSAGAVFSENANTTLYAQWKPITYYIYYDKGLTNDTNTTTIASATRNTNIQSTGTNRPYTKAEYDNNVVVAKRDKLKGTSYSITFDGNLPSDVTQNMKDSYELTLNKSSNSAEASLQELTSSGFTRTIKGTLVSANTWKLEGTLKGTVTLTEGATLTKPNYYNQDGATGVAVAQWNSITLNNYPTPKMDGYVFMGWYDSKSYTLTPDGNGGFNYTPSGNKITTITVNPSTTAYTKTLYAHWKPVMAYLNYSYSDEKAGNYTSYDNGNIVNDLNRGYPTKSVHVGSYYWEYKGTGVNASFFTDYPSKYVPYASIPSPALYFNIDLYPRTSVKDGSNVQGTSNNFSVLMPDKFLNTVYTFTTPNGTKTDLVNANNASETWSRVNATGVSYAKEQAENLKYSYRTYDVYDFTGWYLSNSSENTIGNSIIDSSTKIASKTQDRYDLAAKYQAKPSGMKLPLPKRILVFSLDDEDGTIKNLDNSDEMNKLRALARGESVSYSDSDGVANAYKGRQIVSNTSKTLVYDFNFDGWTNGTNTYNALQQITTSENTKYYAKWGNRNTITLPQVEKGYIFAGWYTVPQNIATTDEYTNPYGSDNNNADKYYAGAGYRIVNGELEAQDCNLRIGQCDINWDISTNHITLYAWFNRKPVFVDVYEGLFFEGQDISLQDLKKLVGVFDFEDDYSAVALEYIESLPTVDKDALYLPVIVDKDTDFEEDKDYSESEILETIQVENYVFDSGRWEPYTSEYWSELAESGMWETVDSIGNADYDNLPNSAEEGSSKDITTNDHPIYIVNGILHTPNGEFDGVYKLIETGEIYYTAEAKAELAYWINDPSNPDYAKYTGIKMRVKEIKYKVVNGAAGEEVKELNVPISTYDAKTEPYEISKYTNNAFINRQGNKVKYRLSTNRVDTSTSRLIFSKDENGELIGEGYFDVTYEVTDNGILFNNAIITNSPITLSYTRECKLQYNRPPQIAVANVFDFTNTDYENYAAFRDMILDSQVVIDGEDNVTNLPWWTKKKTSSKLANTLEIVKLSSVALDEALCDRYEIDKASTESALNSISDLETFYNRYYGTNVWKCITDIDIVVDAHDQWGKYASGKVLGNYKVAKVDEIPETDPDKPKQPEKYRTVSIVLINPEDDLLLNEANVMETVRFINPAFSESSISESNSYWGTANGKNKLTEIFGKKDSHSSGASQTKTYNGDTVNITINDYSN